MALYTATNLPSDGETIEAADVNTDMQGLIDEFNGGIDNDNISASANISISKIDLDDGGSAWTAWTPTPTGFSGTPTVTGSYMQIGKTVFLSCGVDGTSDATTFTITNLPVAPKSDYYGVAGSTKNLSFGAEAGTFYIAAGTTKVVCYPSNTHSAAGWMNSGNKLMHFNIVYEAN